MGMPAQILYYTPEQYLEDELERTYRCEYVDGQIFAMAGASRAHNAITLNIGGFLNSHLAKSPCQAFVNDMKVHIKHKKGEYFYYPDIMVGCEPKDDHKYYLEQPLLIIEVLSDSTKNIDRREKLLAYQTISSLKEYVIISQTEPLVEIYRRDENNQWWKTDFSGEEIVELKSVELSLQMSQIYLKSGVI
jgi:Uma2 family endonuclease